VLFGTFSTTVPWPEFPAKALFYYNFNFTWLKLHMAGLVLRPLYISLIGLIQLYSQRVVCITNAKSITNYHFGIIYNVYKNLQLQKPEGVIGRLFWGNQPEKWGKQTFLKYCAKSMLLGQPLLRTLLHEMGELCRLQLTYFLRILIILSIVCSLDKTKYLSFLVHCPMLIIVEVIPNIVRKSLILTQFWQFELKGNILNDTIVDFLNWYK
jgi:hypothetical protein